MSRGSAEPWESKIRDVELRGLGGSETASVVVSLELPRPRVEMEKSERGGIGALRPRRVATDSEGEQHTAEDQVAQARAFLEQLLGMSPVWLGAARAFGVEASGDQLRAIARSPLVRTIHLSRLRRPPAGAGP